MHRILEPYMSNLHKRQVYAGLIEILKDSKYYYNSRVGAEYNKFTEDGVKAVIEYLSEVAPHMLRKDKEAIEALAKQMVWDELKK